MDVSYRPAREADLEAAMRIVADAINDLRTRHGVVPDFQPPPPVFQRHCLTVDPEGLWIAERNDSMVGFGFAWVCQDFWFLAQLFIRPDAQAAGIGQVLLDKTMTLAERHRASNRSLITFAYNRASTALYIRNGLFPRQPLYVMQAPTARIRESGPTRYETSALPTEPSGWISDLDAQVLGFRRGDHHRFLFGNAAVRGVQVTDAGRPVGYAYIRGGHIGPLAVDPTADAAQVVNAAISAALAGNPDQIDVMVPGTAEAIMAAVSAAGLRIAEPLVLLSAKPFGDWRCYLPNDPGYM